MMSSARLFVLFTVVLFALGCTDERRSPTPPPPPTDSGLPQVLVFTRTAGFRHDSIPAAKEFFAALAADHEFGFTFTEDGSVFRDDLLAPYDVIVFANTTGNVLNKEQQAAFERFMKSGGGFVGVHAAADTEPEWAYYRTMLGAGFVNHPEVPLPVDVHVELPEHPTVAGFARDFRFTDEWYNFDRNPRETATVLLTIDERGFTVPNTPPGPSMGADHPVAWFKQHDGGRVFYTNLGHRIETWSDPSFKRHLVEGLRWAAAGEGFGDAVLTTALRNPLALAVTPTSDVYFIERTGELELYHHDTGQVTQALALQVDTAYENGLLGLALDPDFATNRAVYLYASMPLQADAPVDGPPGRNVLARYTARADGSLDPASRTPLLAVPSERHCCHEGGSLAFASDGTILLSTGDNTNPFDSQGTAPLDARPGRELFDSRRTAGNPNDLRGKVLRLNRDGSPAAGNLFPDRSGGLPQIYAMGVRNPFRVAADPAGPRIFVGDVGPDAVTDSERGPRGYDEINLLARPGDYGWPRCIGAQLPYNLVDFATGAIGAPFDCSGTIPPLFAYDYGPSAYPALLTGMLADGTFIGRTAIAGAVYRARPGAAFAWPARFDGALLMTDWTRNVLASVEVDAAGAVRRVERLVASVPLQKPIDLDVGPDGSLYVLEYGSGFWGDNPDAALRRLTYGKPEALPPAARIEASPKLGPVPLAVHLSAAGSRALGRRQKLTAYAWDLDGDGKMDVTGPEVDTRFTTSGEHRVSLIVTSSNGQSSAPVSETIIVGNTPPRVEIAVPVRGQRLKLGSLVALVGSGTDAEDGDAPCDELVWNVSLVHNTHAHPLVTSHGCTASFVADVGDHTPGHELSFAVELVYTDHGGKNGEAPLTARQGVQYEITP